MTAGEPKFRLVRSISGTKGSQQGDRYVIEAGISIMDFLPLDNIHLTTAERNCQ